MKINRFLYIGFILLVLIGCSKSEDGQQTPEMEEDPEEEVHEEIKNHFTFIPVALEKLARIDQVGSNPKIGPVAHTYWWYCDDPHPYLPSGNPCNKASQPVYSPGDGIINQIEGQIDGRISFFANPTFIWSFAHIDLNPDLREGDPIKAGDFIGMTHSEYNVDFGIINHYVDNSGQFARPERYPLPMRHAQHPIEQFSEPIRSQLMQKLAGNDKTNLGRVSFDVAGTAQGMWFLESAPRDETVFIVDNTYTQLNIGRLAVNPTTRIVRSGTPFEKNGEFPLAMVAGKNEMEWDKITPESGVVQVKLYTFVAKEAIPSDYKNGSLLIEMPDEETLKIEWFNTHEKVENFTAHSRVYVR